jgi:hypothetical protein
MRRHGAAELIRHDPARNSGDYDPDRLYVRGRRYDFTEGRCAFRKRRRPWWLAAKALYDRRLAAIMKNGDANTTPYDLESIYDYSPEVDLPKIQCRGFRRPADAWQSRTRIQEDRARHLRADPPTARTHTGISRITTRRPGSRIW